MKYLVIIEPTSTGYSAYSPDLDGCIATGATLEEVKQNMQEALEFHLEGLQIEGYPIPQSRCVAASVEVTVS
jgi:predicted RNase H-like HicB family nuclease